MRIANNVEMLEISGMGSVIYPVLIWDDDNLILIDTGFPGQKDAIVQAITDVGFLAERLSHIIITHQDLDHIGCVLDLLELSPCAQVLVHVNEAPYIDGRKTPIKLAAMLAQYDSLPEDRKVWCDNFKDGYANRKITANQALSDGDALPICGGIEVIHTPGHTPGHICLFLRESGILVCGDAMNIEGGKVIGPNPQHTYDMDLALRSAEKVKGFPFCAVVAYHGGFMK
jgi:glyoxylase-like metal-dependent hydrolase (beta-lactamase superfamily II)